jgi:hypothetical protein
MKIDPGTLVYILIIVGSFIVNAYIKSKKKKGEEARKPVPDHTDEDEDETPQSRPVWQEELEEILGVPRQPEVKEEPTPQYATPPRTFYEEVQKENNKYVYDYEKVQTEESSLETIHPTEQAIVSDKLKADIPIEEEEVQRFSISNYNDLQRAVVYAEIIQRKNF